MYVKSQWNGEKERLLIFFFLSYEDLALRNAICNQGSVNKASDGVRLCQEGKLDCGS